LNQYSQSKISFCVEFSALIIEFSVKNLKKK
jgi:hypothetical protein